MKSDEIYEHLKALTERLGVSFREQNLRSSGVHARSGFCIVKGKPMFLLDKHQSIRNKVEILASWLAESEADRINGEYIVPFIRELIEKYRQR